MSILHEISLRLKNNFLALEAYFEREFLKTPPVFYLSCDIRHSGFKIAVVDTNLYPAGFNNLCHSFTEQAVKKFQQHLKLLHPQVKNVLIFSEAHTRNRFYFENLLKLSEILTQAGLTVRLGTTSSEYSEPQHMISLGEERKFILYSLKREADTVFTADGWKPDLILSNNDFSSGPEPLFESISQPVVPSMSLGWYQRKKSLHFAHYNQVAQEVSEILQIDPWWISSYCESASAVDFDNEASLQQMQTSVENLLQKIQQKYQQYQITSPPYVFIKNNSGTYGMGVTYVMQSQEVLSLNRKTRNKLLSSKGGAQVDDYLLQEGVVTADSYSGYPIEPVIYMAGSEPVGGFFRLNEERDAWSSLNSKGMAFACLCLHKLDQPHEGPFLRCQEKQALIEVSYFVARIAALAAARE